MEKVGSCGIAEGIGGGAKWAKKMFRKRKM